MTNTHSIWGKVDRKLGLCAKDVLGCAGIWGGSATLLQTDSPGVRFGIFVPRVEVASASFTE
eukprot:SAG31_NODE_258_length_18937_cov_61.688555_26_plen_62_part_00